LELRGGKHRLRGMLLMLKIQLKTPAVLIYVIFATLLSSCKITPPTSSDYDSNYNFSSLKTYAWVQATDEDKKKVSTLENRRQINAIETNLNRKGFQKLDENLESSDFLLRTHTVTDKKVDVDVFYNHWGYYPYGHYPYGYYSPYPFSRHGYGTYSREYEIGTLVLDIIDPAKKEVIWRGSVSRKLGIYKNRTPEERASIALKNATHLLESFPPGK